MSGWKNRYLVVTNDEYELIIFDSLKLSEVAKYCGITENCLKSKISRHKNDQYKVWMGDYKIIVMKEENDEPA